jgi:hypothetical protein
MEAALREYDSPATDPGRSSTFPDPIPAAIFPFFHEEPDQKHYPGETLIHMLMRGIYMGQELKVPDEKCFFISDSFTAIFIEDRREGITDEEAFMEAAFYMSYDIANWLQCAAHFFHVRFL